MLLANVAKGSEENARRVTRIVPALFGGLSGLVLAERHPKWRDVNIAASMPGWSRFPAAEEWLAKAKEQQSFAAILDAQRTAWYQGSQAWVAGFHSRMLT